MLGGALHGGSQPQPPKRSPLANISTGLLIPPPARLCSALPLRCFFERLMVSKRVKRTKRPHLVKGGRARAEGALSKQVAGKQDCDETDSRCASVKGAQPRVAVSPLPVSRGFRSSSLVTITVLFNARRSLY